MPSSWENTMSLMNFKIDQAATFAGLAFLSCEPKLKFGSDTDQECAKDGTPKWVVQLVAASRNSFGGTENNILKVGITSHGNPGSALPPFGPVQLVGLEVGVMEKTRRQADGSEKVIGVTVYYRAEKIRSTADTGSKAA
ncbi:hypothetical protein GCM10029964_128990 [Kibdelosporangium lantanae]